MAQSDEPFKKGRWRFQQQEQEGFPRYESLLGEAIAGRKQSREGRGCINSFMTLGATGQCAAKWHSKKVVGGNSISNSMGSSLII